MGLSRDTDRTRPTCTVWPLEGVKVPFRFSWFLLNISGTALVTNLKFLPFSLFGKCFHF